MTKQELYNLAGLLHKYEKETEEKAKSIMPQKERYINARILIGKAIEITRVQEWVGLDLETENYEK